ncbi:MAG: protein phosphatase 2C domain-containing protein [Anaerolineales bacterium]|jgi:protein phosphatase
MRFWKRLFGTKEGIPRDASSRSTRRLQTKRKRWSSAMSPHILVGSGQSAGIERNHNEDAYLTLVGTSAGDPGMPDFGVFAVADGMGGHRSGEVASAVSVRVVAQRLAEETLPSLLDYQAKGETTPLLEIVRQSIEGANQDVVECAPGSGTTLTVALLLGGQLTIGHVGDSRAYIIVDGKTNIITRDHSFVERMRELGRLTPEEAASHPQRNVLYRAIGQGANLEVDVFTCPAPKDGYLLICSDGLWGVVSDEEISRTIAKFPYPQVACHKLIQAANRAGGPDNISVVLVYFPPD